MENFNQQAPVKKRPVFLSVLSILSFISLGFGFLQVLFSFLTGKLSAEQMEQDKIMLAKQMEMMQDSGDQYFSSLMEQLFNVQNYVNENIYMHNTFILVSLILGLFGVIYMMQGFKRGFHMYIIYNIMSILVFYVSVPASEVPSFMIIVNAIFSALFVFLYSRNLKWMDK